MAEQNLKASLASLSALIGFAAGTIAIGLGDVAGYSNSEMFQWRDYSPELISRLRMERKPLLIHFVADWDLIIHKLRAFVIETPEVRQAVLRHKYTPVLVDCSGLSPPGPPVPLIWKEMESLGVKQLPVTVVIPPGEKRPVVLVGWFTKERLVKALDGEE